MLNQIIVVNKEKGITSRDVVNKLSKILNTKKIGHTGTLDPLASGVLVCLTGKYTKLVPIITSFEKEYIATIKLGIKTDTLDITGNIIEKEKTRLLTKREIIQALNNFKGKYKQTVPIYSAVSIKGKRLYDYARSNEKVLLPTREVKIKNIKLLEANSNTIKFKVLVSKGTYIRSLISDICNSLHVLGTMSDLVRTKQCLFSIEDAYTLDEINNSNHSSIKLKDLLDIKIVNLHEDLYRKVVNGNKIEDDYDGYVLFKLGVKDIALYFFENNVGRLKILF